jgi:hypothetical protein
MADHEKDRGFLDSVKDALGMGDDDESRREAERRDATHGAERGAAGGGATGTLPGDGGVAGEGRVDEPGRIDTERREAGVAERQPEDRDRI